MSYSTEEVQMWVWRGIEVLAQYSQQQNSGDYSQSTPFSEYLDISPSSKGANLPGPLTTLQKYRLVGIASKYLDYYGQITILKLEF